MHLHYPMLPNRDVSLFWAALITVVFLSELFPSCQILTENYLFGTILRHIIVFNHIYIQRDRCYLTELDIDQNTFHNYSTVEE